MSIFEISILNLKKTIHFIHFGVRPPNLCDLTFMVYNSNNYHRRVQTIMLSFIHSRKFCKIWVIICRITFLINKGLLFSVMFLKVASIENSIYVPKMVELVFDFFAFRIHPFFGDVLKNVRSRFYTNVFKFL